MNISSNPKGSGGSQLPHSPPPSSQLPANFKSPFKRVEMRERMDDAFACIATLTGKSLEEVNRVAVTLGYPAQGPAYPTETLMAKLLMALGNLISTRYKDFESTAALPEVAILFIDWDEEMDTGRTVVWHRVQRTGVHPSFSYVIDPGSWIAESRHLHTDIGSLKISWFMAITPSNSDRSPKAPSKKP